MELDPTEMEQVVRRLKRVQGQIGGVIRLIEQGRDCTDVVTQVAAASKALDRAGFAIISAGMQQCLTQPEGDSADLAAMQKLFLTLS